MKKIGIILLGVSLSGCSVFINKKTQLLPKVYMLNSPTTLTKTSKDVKRGNITVTEDKVTVEAPKGE